MQSCKCAFENKIRIPKKQKLSKFHYGTSYLFLLIKTTNVLVVSNLQLPSLSKTIKVLVASNSKGLVALRHQQQKAKWQTSQISKPGEEGLRPAGIPPAPGAPDHWAWTGLHPRSSERTRSDGSWVYGVGNSQPCLSSISVHLNLYKSCMFKVYFKNLYVAGQNRHRCLAKHGAFIFIKLSLTITGIL